MKANGNRDLVTVVGSAASVTAGEFIECLGVWNNYRQHGLQFKAHELKIVPPTTLEGIEKYLGSGMVKGIGPYFAKKLVVIITLPKALDMAVRTRRSQKQLTNLVAGLM